MADEPQVDTYIRTVWEAVCERAGRDPERTCSSADFDLAYRWWGAGIPLRIVLRGIQDTAGKGTTVTYFRSSVEEAVKMWSRAISP